MWLYTRTRRQGGGGGICTEGGRGEVIVERVDFEARQAIDRCLCPLPDVADHVVEARPAPLKHVDGALRCEVLEVDVAGGTVPVLRTTKRSADRDVMAMVAVMMMVVINRQRQDRDR